MSASRRHQESALVQTLSGRRITIGEDRIVEVSEEDAKCLIPSGWITLAEESSQETG